MKWIDKLLTPIDAQTKIEHLSVGDALEGDGISPKSSPVVNGAGDAVAEADIAWDSGQSSFDLKYRLRVLPESWDKVDIVCDGNALDVTTTPLDNGRYIVKRTLRGYEPAQIIEESEVQVYDHATTKDFMKWVEKQDYDTIEAFRQIYYDRWCFDTASHKDKMYYEILEEEKKGKV